MCGIVGILDPDRSLGALREDITSMQAGVKHRGPDGIGHFVAPGVAFGHTRLAIIDLDSTGQQPMTNETGDIHLVINGEIYNYRDLRVQLQKKGHHFRSHSDSEVVLHLYEDFGDDCLQHLEGMFALAIWDSKRRRLLLARDRLGIKPLYIAQRGEIFSFSSELLPLLRSGALAKEIDPQSVYAYMALSYVPGPMSIFKGAQKMLPAERLIWQGGTFTRQHYWKPQQISVPSNRRTAAETLANHLETSVRKHMIADVPVAAFLSGGVDSSAVVAMAQRQHALQTFCVSFSSNQNDEAPYAKAVATHLSVPFQKVTLDLDPVALLSKVLRAMDEPFADSSALPMYAVSQAAREVSKVVLSGDGGDEVFGGYTGRYRVPALQDLVPYPGSVSRLLRKVPPWKSGERSSLPNMLELAALPEAERYLVERQITSCEGRMNLFGHDRTSTFERALQVIPYKALEGTDFQHPVHRALWRDMATSLPDDMLTKVDRMSMAHGLEVRVPLLDHHVVEFALSLPSSWLVSPWPVEGKRLLRQVVDPLLPPGILNRPKQGFCVPLNTWIRDSYKPLLQECCFESYAKIHEFMDQKSLKGLLLEGGEEKSREDLYAILVLELWLRDLDGYD